MNMARKMKKAPKGAAKMAKPAPKPAAESAANGADLDALRAALPSGRRTLRDDLLEKVFEGGVSPAEAARILK